ncbi:MAG: nuclear transport factor 2 family protein [bacterium]|nr:nuclear transport factor 2 family protein [bacterium]
MLTITLKYCLSSLILFSILTCFGCFLDQVSDEETILEMYADVMRAYAREDLKGIMEPIDKDFISEVRDQTDYEELKSTRADFILDNSNVKIDFRNIRINITESDAIVQYLVMLETDLVNSSWTQIDTLQKDGGDWKIITWRVSGETH